MRKENFDDHGAGGERGQIVPGRSWAAWARALGHLLPPMVIADLGCGEGYLTVEAARFAKRVIAVDRSEAVLARRRARPRDRSRRMRELSSGGSAASWNSCRSRTRVSTSRCSRRHCTTPPSPAKALAEAARIVRPGGRVLILELAASR